MSELASELAFSALTEEDRAEWQEVIWGDLLRSTEMQAERHRLLEEKLKGLA